MCKSLSVGQDLVLTGVSPKCILLLVEGNAKLIQTTKTGADTQRWIIVDGVIRLAARKEFVLFLSYGRQGAHAFIRKERRGEILQSCKNMHKELQELSVVSLYIN